MSDPLAEERDRLSQALSALVEANHPIVEDGGSQEQHEAFCEVYTDACFTVGFPHVDPESLSA